MAMVDRASRVKTTPHHRHGVRCQSGIESAHLALQSVCEARQQSGAAGEHNVGEEVFSDVHVAFHDGAAQLLVDRQCARVTDQ